MTSSPYFPGSGYGLNGETMLKHMRWVMKEFAVPIMTRLWFVDRASEYVQFRSGFGKWADVAKSCTGPTSIAPILGGIQVVEWYTRYNTPEDLEKRPAIISQPGIWIEMSDGDFFQLKEPIT